MIKKLLIIILFCFSGLGATWYVDDSAIGSNNGTSWGDAWTNSTAIVWASVSAGDNIEFASGNYSGFSVGKDGSSGLPITIKPTTDILHTGHVFFTNGISCPRSYVTINGAYDSSYVVSNKVADIDNLTNNIRFHITSKVSTDTGVKVATDETDIRLLWLHIYDFGLLTGVYPANSEPGENAIKFQGFLTNSEIAYCWFQDNTFGDNINGPQDCGIWGALKIHDCLFYNVGDDEAQCNGSFDLYRCKFNARTWGLASGHTDVFQSWGSKIRVHHNIIWDNADGNPGASDYNSMGYLQMSTPVQGDFMFYNNLLYAQDTNVMVKMGPGVSFSHDAWWSPDKYNSNVVVTNIIIANNTFALPNSGSLEFTYYYQASDTSRGTNDSYTFTNCMTVNNIFVDGCRTTVGKLQGFVLTAPITNSFGPAIYTDQYRWVLRNNVLAGPNRKVYYVRTNYWTSFDQVETAYGYYSRTNYPLFVSYSYFAQTPAFDFHLAEGDVVARDHGYDLSSYTNVMPDIDRDLDWNLRSGTWDIGAYEFDYTDSSLILHYTFEDGFETNGILLDQSGWTNNGIQYGHGNFTNFPTLTTRTNGGNAGQFDRWADETVPITQAAGRYAAITNKYGFSTNGLSEATFCAWVYFDTVPGGWVNANNQSIIDAGYSKRGNWSWGRNSTKAVTLYLFPSNSIVDYEMLRWTDDSDANGQSAAWHHLTWVWNQGTNWAYYDGLAIRTNTTTYAGCTNITFNGSWVGLGCKTHVSSGSETPQFGDDSYPNHGWLQGKLDDVRVYNRALTPEEIAAIAGTTYTPPVGDTTPPSPNPMTFSTAPISIGTNAIRMTATTASDTTSSPVSYYFDETSGNPGGADSGWQSGTTYTNTGLSTSTTYTYRVKARDAATTPNETSYSSSYNSTTDSAPAPPSTNFGATYRSSTLKQGKY